MDKIKTLQTLFKEIKEGYYSPYFTKRAEEQFTSDSEFDVVDDLKDYMERIVVDFIECRIIEAEAEEDEQSEIIENESDEEEKSCRKCGKTSSLLDDEDICYTCAKERGII